MRSHRIIRGRVMGLRRRHRSCLEDFSLCLFGRTGLEMVVVNVDFTSLPKGGLVGR